jgi:hypothetical protein
MYSHEAFEISANAAADWFVKYLNAPEAADAPEPAMPARPIGPTPTNTPGNKQNPGAAKGATGN